jgi:hypothetical protein
VFTALSVLGEIDRRSHQVQVSKGKRTNGLQPVLLARAVWVPLLPTALGPPCDTGQVPSHIVSVGALLVLSTQFQIGLDTSFPLPSRFHGQSQRASPPILDVSCVMRMFHSARSFSSLVSNGLRHS